MSTGSTPLISVVVCTYNRSAMLLRALESLVVQETAPPFEVIVVDNASTDDTQSVVEGFVERHPESATRLTREDRPGLGHARNNGLAAAQGRYVAYIDDDAVATERWLSTAARLIQELTPSPAVLGGKIVPLYEGPKPEWFRDEYETRTNGPAARYLEADEYLSGSNMILDAEILKQYGGFAEDVGMRGECVSLGEETVLFKRMRESSDSQHRLFYSPDLVVEHSVPASRMTIGSRLGRYMMAGYEDAYSYRSRGRSYLRELLATIFGALRMALASIPKLRRHDHWQNWVVEDLGPVVAQCGKIARLLHMRVRVRR